MKHVCFTLQDDHYINVFFTTYVQPYLILPAVLFLLSAAQGRGSEGDSNSVKTEQTCPLYGVKYELCRVSILSQ